MFDCDNGILKINWTAAYDGMSRLSVRSFWNWAVFEYYTYLAEV